MKVSIRILLLITVIVLIVCDIVYLISALKDSINGENRVIISLLDFVLTEDIALSILFVLTIGLLCIIFI